MAPCLVRTTTTTRVPIDKTWCTQGVKERMNLNQSDQQPLWTLQIKPKTTNLKHRLPSEPSILPPFSPRLNKAKLKWQSHRHKPSFQPLILLRIRIRERVSSAKSHPLDRAWIEFLKVAFMIKIWLDLRVQARKKWSKATWLNNPIRSTKVCPRQICLKSNRTRGWPRKNKIMKSSSFRVAVTLPPTLHTPVPASKKTYSKFQRNPQRDPYLRRRKLWRKVQGKAEINWELSRIRLVLKDSKQRSPVANNP